QPDSRELRGRPSMSTTDTAPDPTRERSPSMRRSGRRVGDSVFGTLSIGAGVLIFVTLALVAIFLTSESMPAILASQELSGTADFSLIDYTLPLTFGPVLASALPLAVATPVPIGLSVFLSHSAARWLAAAPGYRIGMPAAL